MTSTLVPTSPSDTVRPSADPTARRTGAAGLAAALAAASARWIDLVEYRRTGRWTHLLPTVDAAAALDPALHDDLADAQVWLLSWLPDQGTPLHDHGTSAGAFSVVTGTLTERIVTTGSNRVRDSAAELTAGRVRYFGPHYVHQVTNTRAEPAVSVHVYTPGLSWMNTYRVDGDALVRTGTERAGVDW
jgi:mannose-6-phosphate isomerase-like protein (cupin superfamily)